MNFSKICLLVTALSLAVIALRPVLGPQPVAAAQQTFLHDYKYLVVEVHRGGSWRIQDMKAQLDKQVSDGWEFAGAVAADNNVQLIFRKAK